MRLLAFAVFVCTTFAGACARPAARGVERAPVVDVLPAAGSEADAGGGTAVVAGASLDEVARDVYAAIADGRIADARARLEGYDDSNDRCWGRARVTTLSDGGALVSGPHALVVTNASGVIVSHEVIAGCLRFADPTLRIVATETAVRLAERDWIAELPRDEGSASQAERVFVSDAWALVIDGAGGDRVALNRRTGAVLRGQDRDADVAGDWLLTRGDKGVTMRHADGRVVAVRGCEGKLLAAVRTERGELALHVGAAESADTRVCLVRDDGSTRKIVRLGSATCGLARAMPCPFVLQAATRRLVGFGSMRGQITLVDAVVGRTLPVPLPAGASFDGGSPGGVSSCEEGHLCISYSRPPDNDVGVSSVTMVGDKLVARVIAASAAQREPWCIRAGLPVPSAVCEDH